MARKKKTEKRHPAATRHQLSRWQRQQKRQRIILSLGIFIIVAVLLIVGVGWYLSQYRPLHQTVIRVNDTEYDMQYYVDMLKVYGWNRSESYLQNIADEVAKNIERNELIRQEAAKLGISVREDEVTEKLKSYELPDDEVRRDLVRTQLLTVKLLDEHFDRQVPASAEQVHLMAMLLESEPQATEVRDSLEKGESFAEIAGELSADLLSRARQGNFDWHPRAILSELLPDLVVDYAFNAEAGVLSQPLYDEDVDKAVGYWLVKVLDMDEDTGEAHIQAMLLGSEAEAEEILARVEAGEDFATLSEENWGESETVPPGMMSPAVDEYVFDPEVGTGKISQPIRDENITTEGGYWLIKVLDKEENRPISEDDRDLLKAEVFDEWVASLRDSPENEIGHSYLTDEKKLWAIEQALKG